MTAYRYAARACDYERDNYQALAGDDWQQIFGSAVSADGPASSTIQALIDECQRQSENCGYTSTSFTIWLRWQRWIQRFFLTAPCSIWCPRDLEDSGAKIANIGSIFSTARDRAPADLPRAKNRCAINSYTGLGANLRI